MASWGLKYLAAAGGAALLLGAAGACSSTANVPGWNVGGDGGSSSGSGGAGSNGSSSGSASGSNGGSGTSSGSGSGASGSGGPGSGSSSGSGGSGSSSGGSDPITAARQQCVKTINDYRASLSPPSPALAENTAEESCVDTQAQADATSGSPHSAFGNCMEYAQNECPGWPGPPTAIMGYMSMSCLDQMWAEGPPPQGQDNHWLNMENPQYTKVACGFYQDAQGTWWATQDFW